MKFLLSIITTIFLIFININHSKSQKKSEGEKLSILVNGLVCDFCARSIEKLFRKKKSVSSIDVSLEKMLITINLNEGNEINDKDIIEIIKNSGYEVTEIIRGK